MSNRLRDAWLRVYYRLCSAYPARWYWPVVRIFGGSEQSTVYMTRVLLTPMLRAMPWIGFKGGQYYLHVFHREDLDRDPHDHPFDFWTLPINQGYMEDVYWPSGECFTFQRVPHLRWSFRPATHCHRVVGVDRRWPLVTIVWRSPTKRRWGFWVHEREKVSERPTDPRRSWVHWKDYIYGGESANANVSGQDNLCPGTPKTLGQAWRG